METSAIRYRVADFLRQHPPFHAIDEASLLALAGRGRVRFFGPGEYLCWQGEPHKLDVSVIQQGRVSLWDEDGTETLRDVRGTGDLLGIERFAGAPRVMYSARSESDVVIYAFPAGDVADLVLASDQARRFVEAYESPAADYEWLQDARDPTRLFLADVVAGRLPATCSATTTVAEAARTMLATGVDAVAIVDAGQRVTGVVTREALLSWIAAGAGPAEAALASVTAPQPPATRPDASVTEAVLAIADAATDGLAITADGTTGGPLRGLVTSADLGRAFGEEPVAMLREIPRAPDAEALRPLIQRTRAFALQYLINAGSVSWIARWIALADAAVVRRIISLVGADAVDVCWCVCGAAGRGESLTRHAPDVIAIAAGNADVPALAHAFGRVDQALAEAGYLTRDHRPYDAAFRVADQDTWQARFLGWLRDPVREATYRARPFFDLRPVAGLRAPYHALETTITETVDRDLLRLLANDCLASLPPLTFFQDAVVEESGEQTSMFRLEHSALQPLVDVGRVLGLAARAGLGLSTAQRFERARTQLPEHADIFRDAAETLDLLLWQQARIGIAQGTTGAELPASLLSRFDRHALRGGFRSILRLIEFTAASDWVDAL